VTVSADAGWIELRGDVLPDEKEAIIGAVKHIPGVFGVQDQLSEHGWINGQPVA
jgi:osmotically-inducible protein OsmY